MTSNIRGSSICSPKARYKKTSHEILGELKAAFKTGTSKVPKPRPVLPSLLRPICQACVNSQLSPTPAVVTKRKGEEERNKTNFSSCNDRSSKWIINDYYIFFPNLRVWVFLFLRTPFFKIQHVGPILHMLLWLKNSWYWIELIVLNSSAWNDLTVSLFKKPGFNNCLFISCVSCFSMYIYSYNFQIFWLKKIMLKCF